MIQNDYSRSCPGNVPFLLGTFDFGHGQTFFRIELVSGGASEGCHNPAHGAVCSDPGKSGFIYATDPNGEIITETEFNTRRTFICDNGVIREGSTVNQPQPPPSDPNPPAPPPPACADGADNDGDGLTDLIDPGCSGSSDTDESDGTSQCQNGRDDDNDGLVDMQDPGCSSPQDNNESDGTSQCQNGRDDDNDGLIDMQDPGCSSPQDNNESDDPVRLSVSAECVFANPDGSKTAVFSYNNTSGGDLTIPCGSSGATQNQFVPAAAPSEELSLFKSGAVLGAVAVNFSGSSIEWRVRPQGGALAFASVGANTPACQKLVPSAVCQGFLADGTLRVRFGYSNPNLFDVNLPVGQSNSFSPGTAGRGQPTKFLKGLNPNGVEIRLNSPNELITWNLTGNTVSNTGLPACQGECDELPVGTVKTELNEIAIQLANLTKTAAAALKQAAVSDARTSQNSSDSAKKKKRLKQTAEDDFIDAERAAARADEQIRIANQLLLEIPDITVSCPNAPKTCKKLDRITTIEGLRALYAEARNAIKRIVARTNFRRAGRTVRNDPVVVKALNLEGKGSEQLAKLPRFAEECSK
jgi:hypothetical protein